MFAVDSKLIAIKLLFVVQKPERGVSIQQCVRGISSQVQIANGLHDALQAAKHMLPHYIISDHTFDDGSLFDLHTKIKAIPELQATILLSFSPSRVNADNVMLASLGIRSLGLAQLNQLSFTQKMSQVLKASNFLSPYSVFPAKDTDSTVTVAVTALTQLGDAICLRSPVSLDADMVFTPMDNKRAPLLLRAGRHVRLASQFHHCYPAFSIEGDKTEWLGTLPKVASHQIKVERSLFVYSEYDEQYMQMEPILSAYRYKPTRISDFEQLISLAPVIPVKDAALLLASPLTQKQADRIVLAFKGHKNLANVAMIYFGDNSESLQPLNVRQLPFPFGMGQLLWELESLYVQVNELSKVSGIHGTTVVATNVLVVDEVGGVMQSNHEFAKGTKFKFNKCPLSGILKPEWVFSVANVAKSKDLEGTFDIRFEVQQTGIDVAKYYRMVKQHIPAA